jgi:hypothetical protein
LRSKELDGGGSARTGPSDLEFFAGTTLGALGQVDRSYKASIGHEIAVRTATGSNFTGTSFKFFGGISSSNSNF